MAFRPPKAVIPPFPQQLADSLAHIARTVAEDQVRRFAEAAADKFKARLRGERFDSFKEHPLAASTLAKKRALGLPLRVMTATGTYIDGIRVFREPGRNGAVFAVRHDGRLNAVDPQTGRPRRGVKLSQLAVWHEKGTKRMAARPHWGPMLVDLRKAAPAARDRIRRMVVAEWRRRMGTGP